MKIGFIGLGIMGSRMASNLIDGGYDLVVHNRTKDKADELLAKGADWADSPAAVGQASDVVFTMLAHPNAVEAVVLGEQGLLDAMTEGSIWVDTTTSNPMFARRMGAAADARNIHFLDAPVAGSKDAAAGAQLRFLVGGDEAIVEQVKPMMEQMGSGVVHVGERTMGISLKLVVNDILGTTFIAFAEGINLGKSLGIPQEMLLNVLLGGPLAAPFLEGKRSNFESGDYTDVHFPMTLMRKDLQMAAETAFQTGAAMPITNAAKEVFQLAVLDGLGDLDYSALFDFLDASGEIQSNS